MKGKQFRRALRKAGHSNTTFAKLIRRSVRTIQRWANDDTPVPGEIETIIATLKPPTREQRRAGSPR